MSRCPGHCDTRGSQTSHQHPVGDADVKHFTKEHAMTTFEQPIESADFDELPESESLYPAREGFDYPSLPMDAFTSTRVSERRKLDLWAIEIEVTHHARQCGWKVRRRRVYSEGHSIYIDLRLGRKLDVTLRISDHAPGRPIGLPGDLPLILVTMDVPGSLKHAKTWLNEVAINTAKRKRWREQLETAA